MKVIFAILASGVVLAAASAGVDGQWAASTPNGPSGVLLELKSEGGRLAGWLVQPNGKLEIANGSIRGNSLSFEMAVPFQGQPLKLYYSGVLDGDKLRLTLRAEGRAGEELTTFNRVNPLSPIERFSETPAPGEVMAWLKANAIRLAPVQSDAPSTDLMPLLPHLNGARIVAMGEATHGTREFQQLKFRMFRFLVEKLGFTVFGIEANWPESLSVNEYVLGGDVNPSAELGFAWWRTDHNNPHHPTNPEYNQNPTHTRKLKFYGFDMQIPGLAESNVLDYLGRVDPEIVKEAARSFDVLGRWGENKEYETASAEIKERMADTLARLLRRFDERQAEWVLRSSRHDWTMARQNMVIVKQAEVKLRDQSVPGKLFRDRAMAENVKWILDQEPPGTKIMLWAHNGHVAAAAPLEDPDEIPMGGHLRQFFGGEMVSCGFVFGEGSFRAVDIPTGQIRTFTVSAPPQGSFDATLAALGIPLFAVDLRHPPDWFTAPHYSRQIGGGYSEATPGVWMHRIRAARGFDLMIYVDKTTASK
jgi:erythromycin esterase